MSTDATPITRPGTQVEQTPSELLDVAAHAGVVHQWRKDMDRISESEAAAEQESSNIHIR